MQGELQTVQRAGQTWRYYDSGTGQPVVLYHGFPDTPESYTNIAQALNKAGFRTIVPYLRGYHADTIVPDRPYDNITLGEDVIGLLDALELPSATVVGHDWGAQVVYGAAAVDASRLNRLVAIGIPHPRSLKPSLPLLWLSRHFIYFKMPWADAGARRADFAYIERLYRRWAPDWAGPERDAALSRAKAQFQDPAVLHGALDYYRALTPDFDKRMLQTFAVKAMLVMGAHDFGGHVGPYKKSQRLFEPEAELLVVPDAGHWPHRENETMFIEALLRFLS